MATADKKGAPSVRIVLLKDFGEGGFVEIDKLPVRPDDGAKTTVEFWFNWDGRDRTAFGWNQAYGLDFRDGCVGFKVGDSILGVESNGYASGWHHIVAVFNNGEVSDGNIKLYLDGKKQSIDNCRGDVPNIKFTATSKPRIGGLASGSTANFEGGMVDEFAIYNRELTEAEIQNRYIRGAIDVKYQVRTCDLADCEGESFIGPDGTNGSYYSELMNQDDSLPEIPFINLQTDKRYLQYRAFLSSDIKSILPLVKSVSIGPGYYATTNPTIINKTPAPKYSSLQSFVETVEVDNGGSVRYQISNDGDIWYYFNNAVWVEASGFDETNSAQEIDEHLPLFVEDVGIGTFYFKAFLHSGGIGDVKLDSIAIEYEFAGAAILVFESGGSTLVSQDGKKDKYSIVLNKEPQHNVTVMLNVDDEVVVEPQYLVFTPENWAAPQEVTISASENGNDDGPDSVVLSHTSISEDRKYDDLEISDVTIKVERLQISESVPLEEEKEVLETPQEDNQDDESAEGAGSDAAAKAGVAQSCTLIVR